MAITSAADYYRILQVDEEAEPEVIAAAYRKLAAKYHPDVNPGREATARMVEINAAYEVLSDPARRAEYDRARGQWRMPGATGTTGPQRPPPSTMQYLAQTLVLMVVSSIIVNLLFSAVLGPGGRWIALLTIIGFLLWKGPAILKSLNRTR